MKILIASDLHGSALYCERLLSAYEREGAERLLLLGDLLYHGPRNDLPEGYDPKTVIRLLNRKKGEIYCVRGNCDAEVDQMVLEFPIMADYAVFFFANRAVFATHGHLFNREHLPPLHQGDILLNGHTHVAACEDHETYLYCNPGSLSLPKENTPRGYMTAEDHTLYWKTVEGECYRTYEL